MIKTFGSRFTYNLYNGELTSFHKKFPPHLYNKVVRLLDQLNSATRIDTMNIPPGNRLEKLKGNLLGFWSVRINVQWRLIFRWESGTAYDVDIVDYH